MKPLLQAWLTDAPTTDRTPALQDNTFFHAGLYTDPDLLPLELKYVLRRSWQYVGDAAQLAEPGTVKVTTVAGLDILIVRAETGELNAFHNVCPHRASPLESQAGICQRQHLVCPYHGWVYSLDGKLLGTPVQKRFPDGFCREDFPLKPIRLAEWDGWLFVCFDDTAPPLIEFLDPIPQDLQGHRTAATQLLAQKSYAVACNWKNFHDNTLCDYHVAIAHRQTLSPIQGPMRLYEHHFGQYVNLLYTPTTPDWRANYPALEHLGDRSRYGFFTYGIFPNQHFAAMPNGFLLWIRIDPLTVNTCQVNTEIYGIPGITPPGSELVKSIDATMSEDIALTEGVQRGYASGAYTAGIANGLEARILHQQRLIRQFLLDGLKDEDFRHL
jgi:phenylpropionate dioxygenase-like ring-hydroxylating dioxygenase large terminal subunit